MDFDNKNKLTIRTLFNQIAPRYDLINGFMSFFLHKKIKQSAVKNAVKKLGHNPKRILDICCGSGDIAIMFKNLFPDAEVIGLDFSEEMLRIAQKKSGDIDFIQCDVTDEIYPVEGKFDICFISFGLRNLPDIDDFLINIKKHLNDNGVLAILDLGKPKTIFRPYFYFHYRVVIPLIAKIFNRHLEPYLYFVNSAKRYPSQQEMLKKLEKSGFLSSENKDFCFGIISNQVAKYSRIG